MDFLHFMGWDCSRETLDYCLLDRAGLVLAQGQVTNRANAIRRRLVRLQRDHDLNWAQLLHCVDNTGCYSNPILSLVSELDLRLWLEDPFQISRSIGRVKDKTDQIDAMNHARYARLQHEQARLWKPRPKLLSQLQQLNRQRLLLVSSRQRLYTSLHEFQTFTLVDFDPVALKVLEQQLQHTEQAIVALQARIEALIAQDQTARRSYQICRSVPGFGPKNTLVILLVTGLFERITSAAAAASYAGVSPHRRQSGKSLNRRSSTSRAANAEFKTALHQGAMSLMRLDNSFGQLYRRLRQKGRTHLQAINAVRNKMLRVLYACIENDTMYCKKTHESLHIL